MLRHRRLPAREQPPFPKRDLDGLTRSATSLMPVFDASEVSDAALEDLLAYLGTLRGARQNP